MPPAFNLSQDQTLQFNHLARITQTDVRRIKPARKPFRFASASSVSTTYGFYVSPLVSLVASPWRPRSGLPPNRQPKTPPLTPRAHLPPKYPHLSVVQVVKERCA